MPPKDKNLGELYFLQPNGMKVTLGSIETVKVISEPYYDDFFYTGVQIVSSKEYEFTVMAYPSIRTLYFITHGKYPTNNWLRMHGERPNRKKRCYGRRKIQSTDL